MGRQIQIHAFPADINKLVIAMYDKEPIEIAVRRGKTAIPDRLAFIPDNLSGEILVLWTERLAPNLHREYVPAQPPYYQVRESTESVLELSLSGFTTWEGQEALTQGRFYGVFDGKEPEFEKWYERVARYVRRHWRKNPVSWMGGYIGLAASEWFEQGGVLLPNYVPPVRSDWIQRLSKQHVR
jgi:hypothetical protein